MTMHSDRPVMPAVRQMWALGDYHAFATVTVWPLGQLLVDACGVAPGQRVLDVAAGTGNVAIRAAQAGADVVAADLTPEHFEAGRRAAAMLGVSLDWTEADAESLPFPDSAFDVVTSCFGAIFAADHAAVANEMLRVCRPGGMIGMINFKPEGLAAEFFELLGRYAPSAQPAESTPLQWGDRSHVEALFADRVESLDMRVRRTKRRRARRVPRVVQAHVRARDRHPGKPCSRARTPCRVRPFIPGIHDARKSRSTRRPRRVSVHLSPRAWPETRRDD
jgi:SAM-dependent methyltransferase